MNRTKTDNKSGRKQGRPLRKAYKIYIDKDKCKDCRLCIIYCPTKHLKRSSNLNKRGVNSAEVKPNTRCSGCGFCFFICPETCIELYEE